MDKKSLSNFLKRQTFAIFSCLVVIVLGVTLISSALFTLTLNSNKTQVIQSGNFEVEFINGNTISEDIFISDDEEGKATNGYSFSVKNKGTIESSYTILLGRNSEATGTFVENQYIRYSIDDEAPKTLTSNSIYSGSSETDYLYSLKTINKPGNDASVNNHTIKVWIDASAPDSMINRSVNLSIQVVALAADVSNDLGYQFEYSGNEQTYTIPYSGTYTITAAGAQGAVGNGIKGVTDTAKGGKGAKISADFNFNKGDIIHIIVGGMGSTTSTSSNYDGASGAGGGGSFIFKEIPAITASNYQFTKNSLNFEPLLVAAGGSGTEDISYRIDSEESWGNGYDANGVDFKSPSNFVAYSTITVNPTVSTNLTGPLSIKQYIDYNLSGSMYERDDSICRGAYGGGGCDDDGYGYGGGWSSVGYVTYSWSLGENTQGFNGAQEGNGFINIKLKS